MTQKCTECGSTSVRKAGIRYGREKKQRWQCKNCGCIFLKPLSARSQFTGSGDVSPSRHTRKKQSERDE